MLDLQAGVFFIALIFTGILKNLANRLRFLAQPVARSAHSVPTPVGGGLPIVVLFCLVASYFFVDGLIPRPEYLALMGGLLIAVTGLLDDLWHLTIQWRIATQCLAAAWSVWCLGSLAPIDFGFFVLENSWLLSGLAALALLWLLNLYNFMDGIDGLAGTELIFVNLVSFIFVINSGDQVVALLNATLVSAGAGFLIWNWPPAKIFMGDVGSSFIGFSLGVIALLSMQHGTLSLWTWLILLAVFVVDATTTLLRRVLNKQKWYEGHASHAYQNAAKRYKSHGKVTITVLAINSLWLAPLAWLSVQFPRLGLPLAILAMTPLLFLAIRLNAGKLTEVAFPAHDGC